MGTLIRNNLQKYYFIGRMDRAERTIQIDGEGKVTAIPDLGVVAMGTITRADTLAGAQSKSTETMKQLTEKLGALGIAPADIQTTAYNIYPRTKWTEKTGELPDGYEVNQSVTVKIRDVSKANEVVALAGQVGANNVSGLQFIVEDPEQYRAEAREKALEQVAEKARQVSKSLGVRLTGIVAYNELPAGVPEPIFMMDKAAYGGGAPAVSPGSNEVVVRVSVNFEIR